MLREFLNPRHWVPSAARDFTFSFEQISQLCDQAERIFQLEPSVLKLRGEQGGGQGGVGRQGTGPGPRFGSRPSRFTLASM